MTTHRLRAPRHDRAVLAEPPLADAGAAAARNRQRLRRAAGLLLGRPWDELRRLARAEVVAAAGTYLRAGGELVPPGGADSLLMAGHQPELFHPGVWVKNFALGGLARRLGSTPVNLVVDNDAAKTTGLHVPAPSHPFDSAAFRADPQVRLKFLPYDHGPAEEPYEERTVHDEALFAGFPGRVAEEMRGAGAVPLLPAFWAEVLRQAGRTPLLGERLAAARRTFERGWGCANREVPVSLVCQTEAFAWFAGHLLANVASFHAAYNACVQDYRRRYGLRSRQHPVPDLDARGDWREVPFWAWRAGQKRRGRLFARPTAAAVELRVGDESWPALPLRPDGMTAAFRALERRGFKVRSRALTNTLYARLFLADLFIHGIGGGKYDEVTDDIVRRFYGFEPPEYLVLSATLLLPLPSFPADPEDCRRLARTARDLRYNPQRHLDALSSPERKQAARHLAAEKQAWVERPAQGKRERRERFRELRSLNEQMGPFLEPVRDEMERRQRHCEEEVRANAVLRRRDYAFCLYPEAVLRPFCTQFL